MQFLGRALKVAHSAIKFFLLFRFQGGVIRLKKGYLPALTAKLYAIYNTCLLTNNCRKNFAK